MAPKGAVRSTEGAAKIQGKNNFHISYATALTTVTVTFFIVIRFCSLKQHQCKDEYFHIIQGQSFVTSMLNQQTTDKLEFRFSNKDARDF